MNALEQLHALGQSIWLDNLSRQILKDGTLAKYIEENAVTGITSNPTIFHKALSQGDLYAQDLAHIKANIPSPEQRYEALAIQDIQGACDTLAPVFTRTGKDDGWVSLEVSPTLAHDAEGTIMAAERLRQAVARPNLMIKVPATKAGVQAFEELTARGVSVNITLLFSLGQVRAVLQAYLNGLDRWLAQGGATDGLKAVASLFLSRVDSLVDGKLEAIGTEEALSLRGKTAVATAKLAYQHYKELFASEGFKAKKARGQHLLWASTGVKNPAYSDVMYLEPLIGPDTITTLPEKTMMAYMDHGAPHISLEEGIEEAQACHAQLQALGIHLEADVGEPLQEKGLALFAESYQAILEMMKD